MYDQLLSAQANVRAQRVAAAGAAAFSGRPSSALPLQHAPAHTVTVFSPGHGTGSPPSLPPPPTYSSTMLHPKPAPLAFSPSTLTTPVVASKKLSTLASPDSMTGTPLSFSGSTRMSFFGSGDGLTVLQSRPGTASTSKLPDVGHFVHFAPPLVAAPKRGPVTVAVSAAHTSAAHPVTHTTVPQTMHTMDPPSHGHRSGALRPQSAKPQSVLAVAPSPLTVVPTAAASTPAIVHMQFTGSKPVTTQRTRPKSGMPRK
jgi:hypothetical protein